MRLSTTLMATLACTQAIKIEATSGSQANVEFFNDVGDWFDGAVDDIGGGFEFLGDGILDGMD